MLSAPGPPFLKFGSRISLMVAGSVVAQAFSRRRIVSTFPPMRSSPSNRRFAPTYAPCCSKRKASPSALTLGTEIRAAAAELHNLDRGPAAPAGQPGPAVDLQLVAELPRFSEQVHIGFVLERGAPVTDRILKRLLDR